VGSLTIFRLLLHGWHVQPPIVRSAGRLHSHMYCAHEFAAFLLKAWLLLQAVVPLWKVSSAPPRRRTKPGPQGPGFILVLHAPLIPANVGIRFRRD